MLTNRGDGFFVNQAASFATGINPSQLFIEQFDRIGGLDLVTINAGSGDVTLIADFLTAPVASAIVVGDSPVSGIVINNNGVTELLVANANNGALAELLAGVGGFEIVQTIFSSAAPHLSDLAVVSEGNQLQVYGTDASQEIAVLLAIFGPPPPNFLPQLPGAPEGLNLADIPSTAIPSTTRAPFAQPREVTTSTEFDLAPFTGFNIANLLTTARSLFAKAFADDSDTRHAR